MTPRDPAALAAALVRVLQDGELRAQMASHVRQASARNSWPIIAEATERVYRSVALKVDAGVPRGV